MVISVSQFSVFTFSLFILFLSFFLLHFDPHNPTLTLTLTLNSSSQEQFHANDHHERALVTNKKNYIIRFVNYRKAEDHRYYLEQNVDLEGWEWIERNNPAAKFPTDFGLVVIEPDSQLIKKFESLELVKDVSLDLSYQRGVLVEKSKKEGSGAFVDGRKRPGKIFTAMSFGEQGGGGGSSEHGEAVNTSHMKISWRRNLMMQVKCYLLLSCVVI